MPTYVYEVVESEKGCPACHLGFEVRHGMNEPGPEACPRCDSNCPISLRPETTERYGSNALMRKFTPSPPSI